ncbi:MAG: helix-turn-helix transcriptional regulator [Bacteroidales bacterium]|nr:helix-turn-helix transcriptional regulator [Bacteroidales bacterium]
MEQRLQLFLQMEQLSQSQFADKMGIQRSGVTHLLSGRNKPSFEFITRMLQTFPTLNAEWLILGKGKPYKDSSASPEIPVAPQPENLPEANLFTPATELQPVETTEIIDFGNNVQIDEVEEIKRPSPISDAPKAIKAILILYEDGTYEKR